MIKGNPGANRDITRGAFTNGSIGGEQYKAFDYRQCFGVFLDNNDCMSCEARRQCKEALFVWQP
jgi:hypothetical protein